jgi:hypothetical protein
MKVKFIVIISLITMNFFIFPMVKGQTLIFLYFFPVAIVIRFTAFARQRCASLPVYANQFVHCTADSLSTVRLHVTKLIAKTVIKAISVCTYDTQHAH